MEIRGIAAACMTGVLLLSAGCAAHTPKMEVPETDTMAFTLEQEVKAYEKDTVSLPELLPLRHEVQLTAGGTAALYAFDTGEEPLAGEDEITSISGDMVLSSAATYLGEHGSVRDLAESELYRWADATEFTAIRYSQPVQIAEERYLVHLTLDNQQVGMEQTVLYTGLSDHVARIDRLWRTIPDMQKDEGSPAFDAMAAYLASEETL